MHAPWQELATVVSHENLPRRDAHLAVPAEEKDPNRIILPGKSILHCACPLMAGNLSTPQE